MVERRHDPGDPDHEIDTRMLWRVGAGLAAGTIAAGALMLAVFFFEKKHLDSSDPAPPAMAEARAPQAPAGPLLQKDPTADLRAFRASEDRLLSTYGWTDREAGLARVPVTRAMEIVVQEGVAPLGASPEENPR
jgi:hypothetical protein